MARLTHHNFSKLLGAIGELYAHHNLDSFAHVAMAVGRKLVPSDYAIFEEMNLRRKRHNWVTDPVGVDLSGPDAGHDHYFAEHPMVQMLQRTGDMPVKRMSDLITRRKYHETALYREVFRGFGVEYQLGFSLPSPSQSLYVATAHNRNHRDFSDEEKLIFELLRPHLAQAYRNAEIITQLQEQALINEYAFASTHRGIIVLDSKGRIRTCSVKAREWLKLYFVPEKNVTSSRLPQLIRSWMRQQQFPIISSGKIPTPLQPFVLEQNGRQLLIRMITDSIPGQKVLVLEEHQISLSPASLCSLGLTLREAEVLLWVTQGKTSPEIGQIVGCSKATVNKHLEHIFSKLGVETRTTAAVRALEVLRMHAA